MGLWVFMSGIGYILANPLKPSEKTAIVLLRKMVRIGVEWPPPTDLLTEFE